MSPSQKPILPKHDSLMLQIQRNEDEPKNFKLNSRLKLDTLSLENSINVGGQTLDISKPESRQSESSSRMD